MPELRWALIGLGVLFIVGLALWEWRRSRRRQAHAATVGAVPQAGGEAWSRRIEPRIDGLAPAAAARAAEAPLDEVPVIHPAAPAALHIPVAPESAVDVPGAAAAAALQRDVLLEPRPRDPGPGIADGANTAAILPEPAAQPSDSLHHAAQSLPDALPSSAPMPAATTTATATARGRDPVIQWPPHRADRVLTLRVANAQGALLPGRGVRLALEQAGLVHGPQCIYHRIDASGAVLVSAANMLRPGDLDPASMDELQLRGLSLFSVLPGALPPVRMLEELVAVARAVAWRLGATVQDDHGAELDGDRLVQLRQSLPDAAEQDTA